MHGIHEFVSHGIMMSYSGYIEFLVNARSGWVGRPEIALGVELTEKAARKGGVVS